MQRSVGPVFDAILSDDDARRATCVVDKLLTDDFRGALTGGLAIEAQLRFHGRPSERRPLNDVDFVVDSFGAIPEALAGQFLLNHVHPFAPEGKLLLQLIDPHRAIRIDLFRGFGSTLSRSGLLEKDTGAMDVVAVEDLAARATSHVGGRLRAGRAIDIKHAIAFTRLSGLGRGRVLEDAWRDHRQDVPGSFEDATREASSLLAAHPELVVAEEYSTVVTPCERCQDHGPFRCAPPELIVQILGYW